MPEFTIQETRFELPDVAILMGQAVDRLTVQSSPRPYDVEFSSGKPLVDAALEGARLRLRPILMTSFAFILGCVPLWRATGAGSVARQIMGTTVIGGMLAASIIGNFFVPAIFYMVEKWSGAGPEHFAGALPATPAPV